MHRQEAHRFFLQFKHQFPVLPLQQKEVLALSMKLPILSAVQKQVIQDLIALHSWVQKPQFLGSNRMDFQS
ncbi:hypothetical protein BGW36DRAFT_390144 [Talaromyces proteolyticus]|uniref:Uncharacterized protein n=1 Tax=Talaromyces proteolyticus TaxID=1131652 RepID=A0AAD4KGT1_9EURO|nr:uncharacterized protein BGW36DRAFT_390144 [Talaromyces proteolyticus]KAH8690052.1 hypothetical protein BGW36DRAFT_390144 [Talaromyces proteolyticus]